MVDGVPLDGLSPSSLELWRQCPRRFYEEKLAGRERLPGGEEAFLGTFVHLTLELLMQRPSSERTIDSARVDARVAWEEFGAAEDWIDWCDDTGFDPDGMDGYEFRWRAWESICGLFRIEDPAAVEVVATEQFISARLDGAPVRGIVDRLDRDVDGGLVVADYKTGKVPSQRYREPKNRQLTLYAAMLVENGENPNRGRLLFTTHRRELGVPFDPVSVETTVQVVSTAWNDIKTAHATGVWRAAPGPLCGWCPFVEDCTEGLAEIRSRRAAGRLKPTAPAYDLAAPDEVIEWDDGW